MTNGIQNKNSNPYSMFKFDSSYLNPAQVKQNIEVQKKPVLDNKPDVFIKQDKKNSNDRIKKAVLLIAGAAGLITTGVYFLKKHKVPPGSNSSLEFINFENIRNIVSQQKDKLKNGAITVKYNPLRLKTLSKQGADSDFEKLFSLYRYEKFGIESNSPIFPDIVFLKGDNANTDSIGEIFASYLDSKINKVTYPEGKLDEFLQYLSDLADEILSRSTQAPQRNFFSIDNFSKFIDDLENAGTQDKKSIFLNFLQKCFEKNKTSLLVDISNKEKLSDINASAMIVDFKNTIDAEKITHDLQKISDTKMNDFFNSISKIDNKPQGVDYPFWCMGYFQPDTKRENIILEGLNQKLKQQFLEQLSLQSGERLKTFDLSKLSVDDLIEAAAKCKTDFQISGKETILHIQNLEEFIKKYQVDSKEFQNLCDFLNTCYDNYNARAVYEISAHRNIPKELLKLDCKHTVLQMSDLSKETKKAKQEILKVMEEIDLSALSGHSINELKNYAQLLATEHTEELFHDSTLTNILLYGKSKDVLDSVTNSIKKLFRINNAEINFDIKNPDASITLIAEELKKAKELYEKTGKRTLLTIENLDELLVDVDSLTSRSRIGRIKNMAENSVKNNYTTIMIKTTKPLRDFEEASIGDQRFGFKIKLKEKISESSI